MRKNTAGGPKVAVGLIVLLASILVQRGNAHAQATTYLDFDGLTRELRSLTRSDAARMRSVGTSREGREIWVVEIGRGSDTVLRERPALLVVGNLEGDHLVGSSLALEMIRYLMDGAADNPEIQTVLNEQTVYIFPRLNPDGAEAMFGTVRRDRKRNGRPYDDDNDGRIDEDGPEDLNGDGLITVMRVKDPSGDYLIDPDEPRLMKIADPSKSEVGEYTLYWEGTDSDGDGFLNEDGPGGVDLNRSFQHEYPYYERDAGPHMLSEPEARALMDFVVAHRNIGAILTFGLSDNLVTPPDSRGQLASPGVLDLPAFADAANAKIFEAGVFPARPTRGFRGGFGRFGRFGSRGSSFRGAQPGRDNDADSGRKPVTTVNEADQEYFKTVSEAYKSITGINKIGIHRKPEGAFFQYGYFQFGVPSFSTPGWGLPSSESEEEADQDRKAGKTDKAGGGGGLPRRGGGPRTGRGGSGGADAAGDGGIDAQLLTALDSIGIDAFVDWSPFQHPSLGEVEIGGFRPYATSNPPAEELPELGRKHGEFLVRLAGMLPRVRIVDTRVTAHGGGIFTVEAEVENAGYFPTSTQHGVVSRSVQPTIVQIQIPPEDLITGDDKTSRIQKLDGSRNRESFVWVIRGRAGAQVEISVRAQKGGTDTATVTLR